MKPIHFAGKRKSAIAKATLNEGSGMIRVNSVRLDLYKPELAKMKIMEPLILAGDDANTVDLTILIKGGGVISQAEAARLAVARCLVRYNKKLEKVFLNYDRNLLVADVRRKEEHKPNCHGKARAKRQKSYR